MRRHHDHRQARRQRLQHASAIQFRQLEVQEHHVESAAGERPPRRRAVGYMSAGRAAAGLFHEVTERQADQRIIVNDQGIHEPKHNASIRHDANLVKRCDDLG